MRKTKQNDPNRIEPRVVDALAALGSPNENAPITRTDDGIAFIGKLDWQASDSTLVTNRFHLHVFRAGERPPSMWIRGVFPPTPWKRARPGHSRAR